VKDRSLYTAIKENPYRSFATVDEFLDFMKTAPIEERNKVMNYVSAYAQKTYSDTMGM